MIVCQRCGRENDGRYRFCLGCGAALPAVRPGSTAMPPPVPNGPPSGPPPVPAPMAAPIVPPAPSRPTAPQPPTSLPLNVPPPPFGAAATAHPAGLQFVPPPPSAPPRSEGGTAPLGSHGTGQVPLAPLPRRPVPSSSVAATSGQMPRIPDDDIDDVAAAVPRPAPRPAAGVAAPSARPTDAASPQSSRPGTSTSFEHGTPGAATEVLKCIQCSNVIPPSYAFCGVCGTPRRRSEAAAAAPPPAPVAREAGWLALIDDLGNESVRHSLKHGSNAIGRAASNDVTFEQDGLLALQHCILTAEDQPFRLRPIDTYNGTYLRISTPVELHHGDIVRVGQEVLRFERIEDLVAEVSPITGRPLQVGCSMPRGVWGRLCQVGMVRQVANAYLLTHRDVFLGRERGDILFPRDGFVSGSHAVISERGGRVYLKDLGSSNGTFLRVRREIPLRNGDLLLLGRNLLRVHVGAGP